MARYKKKQLVPYAQGLGRPANGVIVRKYVFLNTGKKQYAPVVRGKELRLSWNTKTRAEAYGAMVLNRYVAKLAVAVRGKEKESKNV